MNPETVKTWLERRNTTARVWNLLGAAGALLAGVAVLTVVFWVTYAILWFTTSYFFPLGHGVRLLLAAGLVILFVVAGAKQNRGEFDPLRRQADLAREMDVKLTASNVYGISFKTDATTAAAFEVRSIVSVCNMILCGGAKLLITAFRSLRQFWRLREFDAEGCARVVVLLAETGKRLSFTQIVQNLPGLNPVKTFNDLRFVDGVLFLANDPPGLRLHPELKEELKQLPGAARQSR